MSTNHGQVESLQINLKSRQPMQQLDHATAVAGAGLQGCRHSKPGNERAVLLVDIETLGEFGLLPGEIKENITTRDIDPSSMSPGSQLQLGETVVLEVTGPCAPCRRMDEIRPGLQRQLQGRRGVNCRVLVGGQVRTGDPVVLVRTGRHLP